MNGRFFIGCPVWANKDWVGSFYPPKTKSAQYLVEYGRRLNTVEGNTTFYAVPSSTTLQDWVEKTPASFRFCPKVPRTISHGERLAGRIEEANQFLAVMSGLGERLGPIFLQLPPRYGPTFLPDLQAFLDAWPGQMQLAVEVRHLAWFSSPQYEILNQLLAGYKMARVAIDTRPIRDLRSDPILAGSVYQQLLLARERKPDVPIVPERTAGFIFVRYIGHPALEQNIPFLDEWADRIAGWLAEGADAYVFCHCPDQRLDPALCLALYREVARRISLPALPWERLEQESARQAPLL